MHRHARITDKMERRYRIWCERIERLQDAPVCHTHRGEEFCARYLREVIERRDRVQARLERLRRARGEHFNRALTGVERAFTELQAAWDDAVVRIAWTDPLQTPSHH